MPSTAFNYATPPFWIKKEITLPCHFWSLQIIAVWITAARIRLNENNWLIGLARDIPEARWLKRYISNDPDLNPRLSGCTQKSRLASRNLRNCPLTINKPPRIPPIANNSSRHSPHLAFSLIDVGRFTLSRTTPGFDAAAAPFIKYAEKRVPAVNGRGTERMNVLAPYIARLFAAMMERAEIPAC
eukprot:816432-Pelagomonas_calceolata.AAC.1